MIGNRIRDARKGKKYSQIYMAESILMNQSNYSKIERDLQEPNIYQLKKIAKILNVSTDWLLALTDNQDKDLEFGKEVKNLYDKIYK